MSRLKCAISKQYQQNDVCDQQRLRSTGTSTRLTRLFEDCRFSRDRVKQGDFVIK